MSYKKLKLTIYILCYVFDWFMFMRLLCVQVLEEVCVRAFKIAETYKQ